MSISSAISSGGGYSVLSPEVRDFYSQEIMFQAQPNMKFLQFAKVKRDLTAIRGKAIVFIKYSNLDAGGQLEEHEVLVPKSMAAAEVSISIKEQANAIQVTEMLVRVSLTDVLANASRLLGTDLAKTLDTQLRDTALATTNVLFGGSKAAAANLVAGDALDTGTIKDALELLATNNAPKLQGGEYYVCIAHPHQIRQLRDDAAWVNAMTYMGRRQLYTGEVGMYEGCIFIETTQMPKLTSAQVDAKYSTSGAPIAYEAAFFGDNAYAWAVGLDPELRDDGVVELGRKHTLGWYGIWGSGILENANLVRVLTA
jgi:N4-gp56 family major capsid protein